VGGDDEQAGRAGLRALFEQARAGLGSGDREVIELLLRQGLELGELATVLGVSRGRAQTLASRATDELETCLGVLLAGRAGRDECAELGSLLTGWDGRLTASLAKRAGRHIEHCSACSARRAVELRPSAMLDLTPAAALAAGAAESFRQAAGAPAALKAHTIALATGGGSASAAHTTAVLTRAGTFGWQGFPKQAHGALGAGGAHGASGAGWPRPSVRYSPQGQAAAAAAVVLAVGVAVAGFALSNGQEHLTPAADPKPSVSSADPPTATSAAARPTTAAATTAGRSPAARSTRPVAVTVTHSAVRTTAAAPTTAAPSLTPSSAPSVTSSPSPTAPASQPAGTLRVFPGGGSLFLVPGGRGALLFLSASGGTVSWSVSVSGDPDGTISVSPGLSGTLTAAQPRVTLEITASQDLSCGSKGNPCPVITIEPGGYVFTVTTSGRRHPFKHRRHRRHDGMPAATAAISTRTVLLALG
jgi:hypothetical protein